MFRYSCKGFAGKEKLVVYAGNGKIYNVSLQFYGYQKINVNPTILIFSIGLVDRCKSQTHTFTANVVFKTDTFNVGIDPCHAENSTTEEIEQYRQWCIKVICLLYDNTVNKFDKELTALYKKTDYSEEAKLVLETHNIFISGEIARAITRGCVRLIRFTTQP